MPPEGGTRAGMLPGCPSLDRGSREAEFGFEPRTFRSVNSRSNHLGQLAGFISRITAESLVCHIPQPDLVKKKAASGFSWYDIRDLAVIEYSSIVHNYQEQLRSRMSEFHEF
ncbi:hypothetical protein CSKR_101173 [Clonorchis sinensis]|uniref:Uncharacterized protein n=1 Tax=Clonorchis sinensis TaxID=79923 RepID=A0A3R7H7D2_CLOSI|nr:hypothetical protein CSKR_101173 [Clonorchis sinensis]